MADELAGLRWRAGEPSFADLARRVSAQRLNDGRSTHDARVAKSTIYAAFARGRTRINVDLLREIVVALGQPASLVDAWLADRAAAPVNQVAPRHADPTDPGPAGPHGDGLDRAGLEVQPSPRSVVALILGCVVLNLLGRLLVDSLDLPIFLDMIGTAIVAIALGPWWGAGVGLTTNVAGAAISGSDSLPFAVVNVAGALIWGYGVRRFHLGRTFARYLLLNVLVALACTALAATIIIEIYHGTVARSGAITTTLEGLTHSFVAASIASNLLVSLVDKVVGGFVALVAISALPASFAHALPIARAVSHHQTHEH